MILKNLQVIHINGTSSSGKTAIAKALQEKLLPLIYLNFSIDSVLYALPGSALKRMISGQDISDLNYPALAESYYVAAAALVKHGNRVILDDAICDSALANFFIQSVKGFDVLKIGVHCQLDVLKLREKARGDRNIGEAEWQFTRVHGHFPYDFELDSTHMTPAELADKILGIIG